MSVAWAGNEGLAAHESDVLAYDEAMTALAEGREELIPAPFADRLIRGESPVRVWREYRGLTNRQLAATAGFSPAHLSELESGKKQGSLRALKALAAALRVELDDLVS